MSTQFEEGRYLVRIANQCFIKSAQKQTPGFQLSFRVLCNLDQPETAVKSYQRDMTLWITDRSVKWVLQDLHTLGYEGMTLKGVDPDIEGFHDFRDQEIELICTHEASDAGEIFERWSLQHSKPKLKDKTELDHFDRLLNPERRRVDGGIEVVGDFGITDADVPF